MEAAVEFLRVSPAQLRVSATLSQVERRAHLDKDAIAELAESIATVGILQPLVVRPFNSKDANTGQVRDELVAATKAKAAAKTKKAKGKK